MIAVCREFDAIIVGGGPAGATLAWQMKAAGWRPVILDQAVFPRVKLCAGWITPGVVDGLRLDLADYCRSHTFQPFYGFNIGRLSGKQTLVAFPRQVSYGIVRSEFDNYLLRRSRSEVVEGECVREIRREGKRWIVNERWTAPLLVGAGGHFCPVARFAGVVLRREKKISTLELELKLENPALDRYRVQPEYPELVYFDDIRGYGWCFRKGSFVNIGVGRTQNRHLKGFLIEFLDYLQARKLVPEDSAFLPQKFRGHPYKLHFVTPRPYSGDGYLLIGDAVGLSYNYSGEGIRPAIESALLAWSVLREANGDYSGARLDEYGNGLIARFGSPVTGWKFRLMESLPPFCFQTIGRTIFASAALKRMFTTRMFLRSDRGPE